MNVLLFGASGMVGGGVLTECLEDPSVAEVVSVGRRGLGTRHPKLREVVLADLSTLPQERGKLGHVDACLYCLGISSTGMSEEAYRGVTVGLTVAALDALEDQADHLTFCFVSGQGSGAERPMWSRVKGEAEQAVLGRAFEAYVFRPGFIQPVKGARSRTPAYRVIYAVLGPLTPLLRRIAPGLVTTTEVLARAMLRAAKGGYEKRILETPDINALGGGG